MFFHERYSPLSRVSPFSMNNEPLYDTKKQKTGNPPKFCLAKLCAGNPRKIFAHILCLYLKNIIMIKKDTLKRAKI
jgi:hypothetical protein